MGNSEYIDDGFNLREFIEIVFKRKKIVSGIFFAVVICATVIIFCLPKVYEVRAVVQRGFLNGAILSYPETDTVLKSRYFLRPVFKKMNIDPSKEVKLIQQIKLENIKDTNYFIVKIISVDKELSYSLIQEMVNFYIEYGNSLYISQNNFIKNNIAQIENLAEKTTLGIDREFSIKRDSPLPTNFPDNKVQLKDLLIQKFQFESQLLLAKEFKLIDEPVMPKYSVSPNKRLLFISSCIVGLILGVFAALFIESWKKQD